MMMAAEEYYIFTGREAVPPDVTRVRIDKSISVVPANAFYCHQNITELYCHIGVKKVEVGAFDRCLSLRRVIMPGVEVVQQGAFFACQALTDVECGMLERIGHAAFGGCESLRSISLPSIKIVDYRAFIDCRALTNVSFGKELESIGWSAFAHCTSLECITIPLKDGVITRDNIFTGCESLKHIDLVGALHNTIDALLLEEWRKTMNEQIASISQILPNTPAGTGTDDSLAGYFNIEDAGGKAHAVRLWIRSVLHKIVQYKADHRRYLNEAATTLNLALPNDIVFKNVLPFLKLPSYTFQGED